MRAWLKDIEETEEHHIARELAIVAMPVHQRRGRPVYDSHWLGKEDDATRDAESVVRG